MLGAIALQLNWQLIGAAALVSVGILAVKYGPSLWTQLLAGLKSTPVSPVTPAVETKADLGSAVAHIDALLTYFRATKNAKGLAAANECGKSLFTPAESETRV